VKLYEVICRAMLMTHLLNMPETIDFKA